MRSIKIKLEEDMRSRLMTGVGGVEWPAGVMFEGRGLMSSLFI